MTLKLRIRARIGMPLYASDMMLRLPRRERLIHNTVDLAIRAFGNWSKVV